MQHYAVIVESFHTQFTQLLSLLFSHCAVLSLSLKLAFSIELQQISCCCRWISLQVQAMKLPEAHWQTTVLIFYSSLFITARVLASTISKIKLTTAVQIHYQRKNPSLRILTARPLRMLGILNVRTILFPFWFPFCYFMNFIPDSKLFLCSLKQLIVSMLRGMHLVVRLWDYPLLLFLIALACKC